MSDHASRNGHDRQPDREIPTAFRINDVVRILEGELVGETGSVVGLISNGPEPVYLVETCGGRDMMVAEGEIMLVDGDSAGLEFQDPTIR
jgi:hypothetical protein